MGYTYTGISAAPTADDNGYVTTANMKVGAYTLAATVPGYGARHVTVIRTVVDAADTPTPTFQRPQPLMTTATSPPPT